MGSPRVRVNLTKSHSFEELKVCKKFIALLMIKVYANRSIRRVSYDVSANVFVIRS